MIIIYLFTFKYIYICVRTLDMVDMNNHKQGVQK